MEARSPRRAALAGLALVALARLGAAQCPDAWVFASGGGPPAGASPSLVFDPVHAVSVLFVQGETWEWNGLAWTRVSTLGPSARTAQSMAYDPVRARVVLFGGRDATSVLGDTWEWDGSTWTLRASGGPPAREGHALAFHGPQSKVFLYGGLDAVGGLLDDTWAWDGSAWSTAGTNGNAGPRAFHSMSWGLGSGRVVLYGGRTPLDESDGQAWRLGSTGLSWTLDYPCALFPRQEAALAYDSLRNRLVLFGGLDYDVILSGTTYEAQFSEFVPKTFTGPSPRRSAAMAYDAVRDRMVLFGGVTAFGPSAETWEYRPVGAPGVPSGLSATEARKGAVALSWTDGTPAGSGARVERERWNLGTWSSVTTVGVLGAMQASVFDLPGTGAFRYRVVATSCAGESGWTAPVAVLPARPGGLVLRRISGSVGVTWTDNSEFESQFELQRERRYGFNWGQRTTVAKPAANVSSHTDHVPNGTYRYRILARNAGGDSAWTDWVQITL